jgi:cell division protein FtsL
MDLILIGVSAVMLVSFIVYYAKTAFNEIEKLNTENDLEDIDYGC